MALVLGAHSEPVADCRRTNYLVRAIQPDATVRLAAYMGAVVELTDEEQGLVEALFDPPVHRGVKGTIPRRDIVDAILWVARTGCQWRYLPACNPPWETVWQQWRRWRSNGVWATAMTGPSSSRTFMVASPSSGLPERRQPDAHEHRMLVRVHARPHCPAVGDPQLNRGHRCAATEGSQAGGCRPHGDP